MRNDSLEEDGGRNSPGPNIQSTPTRESVTKPPHRRVNSVRRVRHCNWFRFALWASAQFTKESMALSITELASTLRFHLIT